MSTVIAQLVNEFEFDKDNRGNWVDGHRANVSIKIGNSVKSVKIKQLMYGWEYPDNEKTDPPKVSLCNGTERIIEEIEALGLTVDMSVIFREYKKCLVDINKQEQELIEKRNAEEMEARIKRYDKGWMQRFISNVKANRNPKLRTAEYTIDFCDRERYQLGEIALSLYITYRGLVTIVYMSDGKFSFGQSYNFPEDYNKTNLYKYRVQTIDSHSEDKKYAREVTCMMKIMEFIDEYYESKEYAKIRKEKKEKEIEETLALIKDTFGYEGKRETEYRSNGTFGRNRREWHSEYYYIILPNKKIKVDLEENYCGLGGISMTYESAKEIIKILATDTYKR